MDSHPTLALLAPVPIGLLEDGLEVCEKRGKVAFGSRAWELFRRLDDLRDELPVDVFIYASHTASHELAASWRARYIRHVEGIDGKHPKGRRFRSRLALEDGSGYWAVFWEVEALERIEPIPISGMRDYQATEDYGTPFVPEGPIIIDHP